MLSIKGTSSPASSGLASLKTPVSVHKRRRSRFITPFLSAHNQFTPIPCSVYRIAVQEDIGLRLAGYAAHVLVGPWTEDHVGGRYLGQVQLLPNQDFAMEILISSRHRDCRFAFKKTVRGSYKYEHPKYCFIQYNIYIYIVNKICIFI